MIGERWGSVKAFQEEFKRVLLGIRGSGWEWLVWVVERQEVGIVTTRDQEIVPRGCKPLLGVDMWEHAYYLQYLNDKAEYVENIWKVVNWETVEKRFVQGPEDFYGCLNDLVMLVERRGVL